MKRHTDVRRGFRDVYWCGAMNEPFIISYNPATKEPWCDYCKSSLGPVGEVVVDDGDHWFVTNVSKRAAMYAARASDAH